MEHFYSKLGHDAPVTGVLIHYKIFTMESLILAQDER